MKRLAPIALALALLAPAPAIAASVDWRPERPDRLALFDAEMAPLLVALPDAVLAIQSDIIIVADFVQLAPSAALVANMEQRLAAAKQLARDLLALQELAGRGVGVLDRHSPEECWAQYWAVMMTGWLLIGDSIDSFEGNDFTAANTQIGGGTYLLNAYGSLVHGAAEVDCA